MLAQVGPRLSKSCPKDFGGDHITRRRKPATLEPSTKLWLDNYGDGKSKYFETQPDRAEAKDWSLKDSGRETESAGKHTVAK